MQGAKAGPKSRAQKQGANSRAQKQGVKAGRKSRSQNQVAKAGRKNRARKKQGPKVGRKSRAQTQDVKAGRTLVQSFTIIPVLSVTYSYTTMCSCSLLSFILTSLDLHSKSYHTLYVLR